MLSDNALEQIRWEIDKYPEDHARAAVMAALRIAQHEHGWLSPELMKYVADMLQIEPIKVAEVATFYTMYDREPIGRHKISLCTNISCMLRGSSALAAYLQEKIGIGFGQTTEDGRFTLKEVECLAACGGAPCAIIGEDYHENLTPDKLDEILDQLK